MGDAANDAERRADREREEDEEIRRGWPPTPGELEAARKRLDPYLRGYPEPLIDARRLRLSNGTASEQERREIRAEDVVIREFLARRPAAPARPRDLTGPVERTERAAEDSAIRFSSTGSRSSRSASSSGSSTAAASSTISSRRRARVSRSATTSRPFSGSRASSTPARPAR
jgi:hypothetical protein